MRRELRLALSLVSAFLLSAPTLGETIRLSRDDARFVYSYLDQPINRDEFWQYWGSNSDKKLTDAVVRFEKPAGSADGTRFAFRLIHNSKMPDQQLGHFRMYVTTSPAATFRSGFDPSGASWIPIKPRSVEFNIGQSSAAISDDGAILISGDNVRCMYTLRWDSRMPGITGIRIQPLPHRSFPLNGPGRGMYGRFKVSAIEVDATDVWPATVSWRKAQPAMIKLPVRREMPERDSGFFMPVRHTRADRTLDIEPRKTAVVVLDMWEGQRCVSTVRREAEMIAPMNLALAAARRLGMTVVFAPARVIDQYEEHPARKLARTLAKGMPVIAPPLFLDQVNQIPWLVNGKCECNTRLPCDKYPLQRIAQHPGLVMEDGDLMSNPDDFQEMASIFRRKGINTVLFAGLASNKCVTVRACGMVPMGLAGFRTVMLRDLVIGTSGNGHNPDTGDLDPTLSPERGTDIICHYIERYIGPSALSFHLVKLAAQL